MTRNTPAIQPDADLGHSPRQATRQRRFWDNCLLVTQLAGKLLAVVSAVHWVPGLGVVLLLVVGWFLPAAAILGGLMLVQWPVLLCFRQIERMQRQSERETRRALAPLANPSHLNASHKLRPPG